MALEIQSEDPADPEITALLNVHLAFMNSLSPPESVHALDVEALRASNITFWTVRDQDALIGCVALKELDGSHGEIKSMHTSQSKRGQGIAQSILEHLISEAKSRGYKRISFETGNIEAFYPAHRLYRRNGFVSCEPFADYKPDSFSICMTREL